MLLLFLIEVEPNEGFSGVPQGSILGPLLFVIFINDIDLEVNKSTVSCYADDSKVGLQIVSTEDRSFLQADLSSLYNWTDNNLMKFNEDKLEFIRFSKKAASDSLCYVSKNGDSIRRVDVADGIFIYLCKGIYLGYRAQKTPEIPSPISLVN